MSYPSQTVFNFLNHTASYDSKDTFVVKIDPSISDTGELIKSLYYQMRFPGYFGFNWNALDDFLRDLSWIEEEKVVIIHKFLPQINENDLKVYLEILRDSVVDWFDEDEPKLEVCFSENEKEKVLQILSLE